MKNKGVFYSLGYDANHSFLFPETGFLFLGYSPFRLGNMDEKTVTFNSCSFDKPDGPCFKITWELENYK